MPLRIPAIVLASGGSTRMGRCKALLDLGGKALLCWHVDRLRRAGFAPVVTTGGDAAAVEAVLAPRDDVRVIRIRNWSNGSPIHSLQAALGSLHTPRGALVTPVDVPPPDAATLVALRAPVDAIPVGPDGRPGHPVRLAAATCQAVRTAPDPRGLRGHLERARRLDVPTNVGDDFDTLEAWQRFVACWSDPTSPAVGPPKWPEATTTPWRGEKGNG